VALMTIGQPPSGVVIARRLTSPKSPNRCSVTIES
jgi:hypothetical protein